MEKLWVVSSDLQEALSRAVLDLDPKSEHSAVLHTRMILERGRCFDVFDMDREEVSWLPKATRPLVNRNFGTPLAWFDPFAPEDRYYAQREFDAYLGAVLSSVHPKERHYLGKAPGLISMAAQWERVRVLCRGEGSSLALSVPRYRWTRGFPESTETTRWIRTNPYSYWNFKESIPEGQLADLGSTFEFARPTGETVIVSRIGGDYRVHLPNPSSELSDDRRDAATSAAVLVLNHFGISFGEALIFVDHQKCTFGMATSHFGIAHLDWPVFLERVGKCLLSC